MAFSELLASSVLKVCISSVTQSCQLFATPWTAARQACLCITRDGELDISKLRAEELMLLNCGVGEESWESLRQQGVNRKGNQPWIFIGRTDAEAEAPASDVSSWLIGKDPDAGKDWRQGMTEDEMVRWHHWLDGHEFEQAPGVGDGQASLHSPLSLSSIGSLVPIHFLP